jgi:hypothetical protein
MMKMAFERESSNRPRIRRFAIDIKKWQEGKTMWDIGCVVASMLFFCIAIGYAMGCDRLGAKETQK